MVMERRKSQCLLRGVMATICLESRMLDIGQTMFGKDMLESNMWTRLSNIKECREFIAKNNHLLLEDKNKLTKKNILDYIKALKNEAKMYEDFCKTKPEFKILGENIIREGKALLQDAINWSRAA